MLSAVATFALKAALVAAACIPNTVPNASPPKNNNANSGNSGNAGSSSGVAIHPTANSGFCLDVQGNDQRDGTPVQVWECNNTGAQKWVVANGAVKLAGTNFCLDAGSYPGSGVQMKIWTCYSGLPAQQWDYSNNRLTLKNKNQCLDLPDGGAWNGHVVQTWECFNGNTNQAWTTTSLRRRATSDVDNVQKATCSKANATPGRKAGLASGNLRDLGDNANLFGWWYDWNAVPKGHWGGGLAIPMLWGGAKAPQYNRYAEFTSTWSSSNAPAYVLGFNEPDCPTSDSSNLDVNTAASLWNQYIAPLGNAGSFTLSPALCGTGINGNPAEWHRQFKSKISADYDAMAVHIYHTNLDGVKQAVDMYWNIYQKPIWVTEFACIDTNNGFTPCSGVGYIQSFVQQVVDYFESDGRVHAYALVDGGGDMVTNYGYNNISPVGQAYVNAVKKHYG